MFPRMWCRVQPHKGQRLAVKFTARDLRDTSQNITFNSFHTSNYIYTYIYKCILRKTPHHVGPEKSCQLKIFAYSKSLKSNYVEISNTTRFRITRNDGSTVSFNWFYLQFTIVIRRKVHVNFIVNFIGMWGDPNASSTITAWLLYL